MSVPHLLTMQTGYSLLIIPCSVLRPMNPFANERTIMLHVFLVRVFVCVQSVLCLF